MPLEGKERRRHVVGERPVEVLEINGRLLLSPARSGGQATGGVVARAAVKFVVICVEHCVRKLLKVLRREELVVALERRITARKWTNAVLSEREGAGGVSKQVRYGGKGVQQRDGAQRSGERARTYATGSSQHAG